MGGFLVDFGQVMLASEGCVSALLEHGASALYRDSQGKTPLHISASLGHTELLRSLLKAALKADPLDSMLDYSGYTPTHWAAYHGEKINPLRCATDGHKLQKRLLFKEQFKSFFF